MSDEHTAADASERALTAPQFRLKGAGWYETDFKRDGEKKRNLVEGKAPETGAASDAKPAETKPATETKAPADKAPSPATSN